VGPELQRALTRLLIVFTLLPILVGGLNGLRNLILARREAMYAEHRKAIHRDALRRHRNKEAARDSRPRRRTAPRIQGGRDG